MNDIYVGTKEAFFQGHDACLRDVKQILEQANKLEDAAEALMLINQEIENL